MQNHPIDTIINYIHIDVIKILEVRLGKTLFNREVDQTMAWAYLHGMDDVVMKSDKEQFFNVFMPEMARPSSPKQQATSTLGNARKEAKRVVAKNTSDRVRALRKTKKATK